MSDEREEAITDLSTQRTRMAREDRVDYLEEERERRARQLAFEDGARQAVVDAQLNSHEKRLNAINGSIERTGKHLRELAERIDTKNAVDEALRSAIEKANANSLNDRTFRWGAIGVMVMLMGVCISLLVAVHVL